MFQRGTQWYFSTKHGDSEDVNDNDIFKKQTEQKQWNNQNYCPISPDRRTPHLSARRWNVFRWHRSCIPKLLSTSLGGERGSWGQTILIFMLWVMMVCNEMFAPFQAFPTGDHADLREDPDETSGTICVKVTIQDSKLGSSSVSLSCPDFQLSPDRYNALMHARDLGDFVGEMVRRMLMSPQRDFKTN